MTDELVPVGRYLTVAKADICRATLAAEGIDSIVLSDDAGGMQPQLQMTQGVRLLVREGDLERAREILETGVD